MDDEVMTMLREMMPDRVRFGVPLSTLSTFGLGGPASALVEPESTPELVFVLKYARANNLPVFFLGRGSNVLFMDSGFAGMVIRLGRGFSRTGVIRDEGKQVLVESGAAASLHNLIELSIQHGLAGLEFLAGIPGSVGGALAMNAGAFGGEIIQALSSLNILDAHYTESRLDRTEIKAEYRRLLLPDRAFILGAVFSLKRSTTESVKKKVADNLEARRDRQPLGFKSAGSIFKNPPGGRSAGELIEKAGFKGRKIGQAWVSEKHANFIVHKGEARADDVIKLIDLIQSEVKIKFGIDLEPEIELVGPESLFTQEAG